MTVLFTSSRTGDLGALRELTDLLYRELRRMAQHVLSNERPNHTLSATALVHEAFVHLADGQEIEFQDRAHFFALAAQQMRWILVDHSRRKRAAKRDGGAPVDFEQACLQAADAPDVDLTRLDEALSILSTRDPRAAQIVEMRYFAGMTIQEISAVLGLSSATIKRDWEAARAFLRREMTDQ